MTQPKMCRWCAVPIRAVEVLVGAPPGRLVMLMIDVDPHPAGRVIVRDDDRMFRMIEPRKDPDPNKSAYRVHGAKSCGKGKPVSP